MATLRATDSHVGAASSAVVALPIGATAGDRLVSLVFSGNRVTGWTLDLERLADTWGQEAQGSVLTKVLTADDIADGQYSVYFDGGDPHRIVTIVTVGDAGYQLVTSARDGVASSTFPAYDQSESAATIAGEIVCYFVGSRGATSMPTSTSGTLTESYSGTHTMGFWVDTATDSATGTTLGIPSRSGHYRAVVRFFDWVPGGWLTDADAVPVTCASANSNQPVGSPVSPQWDSSAHRSTYPGATDGDLLDHAWNGDDSPTKSTVSGIWSLSRSALGEGSVNWSQVWVAVQRTEVTAEASTVPGSWPATAKAVEWEPSSTPEGYTLGVSTGFVGSNAPAAGTFTTGDVFHCKVVDGASVASGAYDPGFLTAAAFGGISDAATAAYSGVGALTLSVDVDLAPDDLGSWVAATLVDPATNDQDTSHSLATDTLYSIGASLKANIRPRYRFLYDPLDRRRKYPLRRYPVDNGAFGPTRHYPPPKSRRHAGGYR